MPESQERGRIATALRLFLPLLRSPLLWGCGDASTEAELTGAPGSVGQRPTASSLRAFGRPLAGGAGSKAGPRGVRKHQRAPAQTEQLGLDTWGRFNQANRNRNVSVPHLSVLSHSLQSTASFIASLNLIPTAFLLQIGQLVRESHATRVLVA